MKEKLMSWPEKAAIVVFTVFTAHTAVEAFGEQVDVKALDQIKNRDEATEIFITDHTPDLLGNTEQTLDSLYESVREDGFEAVRFDLRWNLIEPEKGKFDSAHLKEYQEAIVEMSENGLDDPILILSSVPSWAKEQYETNKEAFFESFKGYAACVKDGIAGLLGKQISHLQLFNELNHPLYNFIEIDDLPRLVEITKEVFYDYNPNLKIFSTVLVSDLLEIGDNFGYGHEIMAYLGELKRVKDCFDGIGIDYYPGTWQIKFDRWRDYTNAIKDILTCFTDRKEILIDNFHDLAPLEQVFREVSTWGIEYYLTETGFPSNWPWLNEDFQEMFYVVFFRDLDLLFKEFEREGISLPSKIGIYQARDESPKSALSWFLRVATPTPMNNWGIRESNGDPKEAVEDGVINKITDKF